MAQQNPSPEGDQPQGDPWHAFGYVVAGVAVYGVLGFLADRWLGTSYLVAVGIIVGAAFGIYMTFARFNQASPKQGPHAGPPQDPPAPAPEHPQP